MNMSRQPDERVKSLSPPSLPWYAQTRSPLEALYDPNDELPWWSQRVARPGVGTVTASPPDNEPPKGRRPVDELIIEIDSLLYRMASLAIRQYPEVAGDDPIIADELVSGLVDSTS